MDRPALRALAVVWTSLGVMGACASGSDVGAPGGEGSGDAAASNLPDGSAGDAHASDAGASTDARLSDAASGTSQDGATGEAGSGSPGDGGATEASTSDSGSTSTDASPSDAGSTDTGAVDTGTVTGHDAATGGILTGGPCASGATGATAIRIGWVNAGGTAMVQYLSEGLPDPSKDQAGVYGYQIGFTPSFVDPYLAQGGVAVDDSDFIDIQMTTVGISSITSATLSIYGRSYDVSASGSFSWQTFDGINGTPVDFVSNTAPYQWYSADMTTEIGPGESNVLVRIKAGPSSGSLVVNQAEICMVAN